VSVILMRGSEGGVLHGLIPWKAVAVKFNLER
jgi:hypothetical protein